LELLRCYYNFVRPYRVPRFGREVRTPAMQAGLIGKRLTLRRDDAAESQFHLSTVRSLRFACTEVASRSTVVLTA
jgi:hypothetical protein